ncbi:MAG: hypothetical protein EBE86_009410 [Hormoscilla sp. GUM202]|nr:hypothetical protein [Hormoscilla sp. GUM202]
MTNTQTSTGLGGTVSVAIASLPDSPEPSKHKPGIKELLAQLQDAIASESNLDEDDKENALKQLNNLAKAVKKPGDGGVANSTLERTEIESLEKLYSFKEPQAVYDFLESNPFLVPLLQEAHGEIRKHFPNSRLFLQYITDPEIYNPQLAVFLTRPENLDVEERIDLLERLGDDWWLDAKPRSQRKMIICFE